MRIMGIVFSLCLMLLAVTPVLAQQGPQSQPSPSVADLTQQLQQVGCNAERTAAAQTIVQLRQQVSDLQKQLAKDPLPPKKK